MAYLHCHTKNCGWSQDDFWYFKLKNPFYIIKDNIIRRKPYISLGKNTLHFNPRFLGYNPLSLIIEDLFEYGRPRWIGFDSFFIEENNFKYRQGKEFKEVFSWRLLIWNIKRNINSLFKQKWWAYKYWKKDYDNGAVCPKCGERNFDID